MHEARQSPWNKKTIWWIAGAVVAVAITAAVILLLLRNCEGTDLPSSPTLTVETPGQIPAQSDEPFIVELTINDFGQALYPAASFNIQFDSSKLEFLGIKDGNVCVHADPNPAGKPEKLPAWSCDTKESNRSGQIRIMYLDITGGKYAFDRKLLKEGPHTVIRLSFRLRGNAVPGDGLDLTVLDAVFAASDAQESLGMTTKTLIVQNGVIKVGDPS